jgi:hypothetical protein
MAKTELFVRKQSGGMFTIANEGMTTGNIFFVNSATGTNGAGYGQNPDSPVASIDYAVGLCTANNGDRIYVMPGHTETIVAGAGLALDVAGVTIIGLGNGTNRPKITFTTLTTADMDVDAANVTLRNFQIDLNDVDALAAPIDVNAADFTMQSCTIFASDATNQPTLGILTDANANRMLIENCEWIGTSDAGCTTAIRIVGGDSIKIRNCLLRGGFTTTVGAIQVLTTATTNLLVEYCDIHNNTASSTACITGLASTTGTIRYNTLRNQTDGSVAWIGTPGNTQLFQNYGVNNVGETGILVGTPSV